MYKPQLLTALVLILFATIGDAQDSVEIALAKSQAAQQQRFAKLYEDAAAKLIQSDPAKAEQLMAKAENALAKAAELSRKAAEFEIAASDSEAKRRREAEERAAAAAEKNRAVIRSLTVHCDIKNEDKEKPGSFKVQVVKDGKTIYERSGWGLEEGWDDNTAHSTASGDVSSLRLDPNGNYTLKVWIDNGKRIDVATNFYLTVADSTGSSRQTSSASHFWRNGQSSAEWSLIAN